MSAEANYNALIANTYNLGILIVPWTDCQIIEQIGRGASMEVFQGICKIGGSKRNVAFKFTNTVLTDKTGAVRTKQALKDVLQEVRIMGQLKDHPHVVQLLGA